MAVNRMAIYIIVATLVSVALTIIAIVISYKKTFKYAFSPQQYYSKTQLLQFSSDGKTLGAYPVPLRSITANAFTASPNAVVRMDDTTIVIPQTTFQRQVINTPAHYGYATGIYSIDDTSTSQAQCDVACFTDPYCHSCSYDPKMGCMKSVMNAKILLKYFASDLVNNSPFTSDPNSEVHFIVRSPTLLTGLTSSTCDCNTLCSVSQIGSEGSYSLGTVTSTGQFLPSGQLTTNDAMTRLLSWQETRFCGSNPSAAACPAFDGTPISSSLLDSWVTGGSQTPTLFQSLKLLDLYSSGELMQAQALANAKSAYKNQQSDFFTMFSHAVDHKVCVCVQDATRKVVPMDPLLWNIQSYTCPFRLPDVEDFDPKSILTDQPTFNPHNTFL